MRRIIRCVFGFATYYASFFWFLIILPLLDPRETEARFRVRLRAAIQLALKAFGVELTVTGRENLQRQKNAIIVANHSSWFDQMALVAALDVPMTFMAKQKYFEIPGLKRVLRKLGCVPVSPDSVNESMSAGRRLLEDGKWLVVYPEGTRSRGLLPFRRGAALLAEQTGLSIQPIVIRGAREVLPRMKSFLSVQPGTIELQIHTPLEKSEGMSAQEFMVEIEDHFAEGRAACPKRTQSGRIETGVHTGQILVDGAAQTS